MKVNFKIFFLLLSVLVVFGAMSAVSASAAEGNTNIYLEVSATEVAVGDTVTVTVYNYDVTAKGFGVLVYFDKDLLTCTNLTGVDDDEWLGLYAPGKKAPAWTDFTQVDDVESTNSDGIFSAAVIGTADKLYYEGKVVTLTFTAKAAGKVIITLEEQTSGEDGFKGVADTATLTIKEAAPACDHENTTAVPNGDGTHDVVCQNTECGATVKDDEKCSGGTATCGSWAICATCKTTYGELNKENHAPDPKDSYYRNNGKDHTFVCSCGEDLETESHDYATGTSAHTCICGKVETFKLTVDDMADENKTFEVPYGTNILEFIAGKVETGNVAVNTELHKGYLVWTGYWEVVDSEAEEVTKDDVMSGNLEICAPTISTGWERSEADDPWSYFDENGVALIGWNEIDGAWYYFIEDEVEGWHYRAEGLTRVPYPTMAINGVTYAPNAADKAYWEAHKATSNYSDAETAVFVFDVNGKLVQTTGIVNDGDKTRYAVRGMVEWHVGFVEVKGDYYYFVGDQTEAKGGNVADTGKVYATRDFNTEKPVGGTCIYYFDDAGKLIKNEGIVEIEDIRYYFDDNNKLALGQGLTKVGDSSYIFVRSNGQLATGARYVGTTKYEFDENGFTSGVKNGFVGGKFYKDGHLKYGLVEFEGDIYYITSQGKAATGAYYINQTNDMVGFERGDKLFFDEDGKMLPIKNGIVEEGDKLYYYENNHLAYGAGVLELQDEQGETFYIYVRSNGELATNKYWPTTRNGKLESGEYDWGEDGKYYPGK